MADNCFWEAIEGGVEKKEELELGNWNMKF